MAEGPFFTGVHTDLNETLKHAVLFTEKGPGGIHPIIRVQSR